MHFVRCNRSRAPRHPRPRSRHSTHSRAMPHGERGARRIQWRDLQSRRDPSRVKRTRRTVSHARRCRNAGDGDQRMGSGSTAAPSRNVRTRRMVSRQQRTSPRSRSTRHRSDALDDCAEFEPPDARIRQRDSSDSQTSRAKRPTSRPLLRTFVCREGLSASARSTKAFVHFDQDICCTHR